MRQTSDSRISMVCLAVMACFLSGGRATKADFLFGEPTNLGPGINSNYSDGVGPMSADGLELYISSGRPPGTETYWDIWIMTRATTNEDWGTPVRLDAPLNTPQTDYPTCLSADGLELYIGSTRPGGSGGEDIWVARRESVQSSWGPPENLGTVINSSGHDFCWSISHDGLELHMNSGRPGGFGDQDLYVARRTTKDDPWQRPVNLGQTLNSSATEWFPNILADGRILIFSSNRASWTGAMGEEDIWIATRATSGEAWGIPTNIGSPVNSSFRDSPSTVSSDGSALYFSSARPGGLGGPWGDIWQSPIIPVVDFNGDGKVDGFEVCVMADRWGTDDSVCDIGPMPWGDGVVDLQDLTVLAAYIGKDVVDPTLIAHWALDETEGDVAGDSAGDNDGTLMGDPVWEPEAGIVDGALAFDGVDDGIVVSEQVLSPADGPFSVLAWIKGGAPGQVLISQTDGMNWLIIDPSEGTLATELVPPAGRFPVPPLVSDVAITDGLWHRIAFVWDGACRSLHVDGTLVVADEQSSLAECSGGLNIGCGNDMAPATFFAGLIDDVRIYNRAVRP
jgi:Concanavalin A-like lectin/glucanases superfamily/WD40-like Beta Propeller Repeat